MMNAWLLLLLYVINGEDECGMGIEMIKEILPGDNPEGYGYRVSLSDAADDYGAVCLDGTTPDFYYRPGFDDGITKFNINIAAGSFISIFFIIHMIQIYPI